ncbi:DUF1835 domain-containing protein [Paenibacillus chibensis]|uniref:DUF1835 domain-containing protein n=1 Tax=Paenibacillus chibensis TaxID=59846 RepID=UPI0013E3EBDC|nr:DUF1835 domain-containing protein [Paenibacillus chibensis]MEC0371354.1 DUF1835 domain-containing protein [Paenibacillus chibensis]
MRIEKMHQAEQERHPWKKYIHIAFLSADSGSIKVALNTDHRLESQVIHWNDFYAFGPLWKIHTEQGLVQRETWIMERFNNRFFHSLQDRENRAIHILKLLREIPDHRRIYLWCGDNVHDQVALRLAVYALQDKLNDVYIMNVTRLYPPTAHRYDPEITPLHIGSVPFEALEEIVNSYHSAQPVNHEIQELLEHEWLHLSLSTDTLRTFENGIIVGLDEHAFDEEILNCIRELQLSGDPEYVQDGYVKMGRVAGELSERKKVGSDPFIEYRIWHLISSGYLEFKGIPYAMYLYSVKIRD